jgi:hypothetical protein
MTTSPRAAPPRVACGPWAATCAADSAGRCIMVLGGPSPSLLPTTTWIWSGSARATAYLMTRSESRLEGVNRANLKFTNFKHNYKPGLALEI